VPPRSSGDQVLLVTATDGNHGRAVARMARTLGQRALVFVPGGVHPAALAAIAAEGAQITTVPGSYDDAVRLAAEAASGHEQAVLVQDTGWPGYQQIPGWIVEGYSTLFAEVDAQLSAAGAPGADLVVIPTGVGSLAQAAVAHYRGRPGPGPALMSVEPVTAAGVLTSLTEGRLVSVPTGHTVMAGLNCGTPSALAWPYLRDGLDAACAVTESDSITATRELAGYRISAGPCGAAALAGARAALTGTRAGARRTALAVGPDAAVVLLNTEGTAANPLPAAPGPG
jgi:diaminopropionate ammonia-lyase